MAKQCKPLEASKYVITDANLDNIIHRTSQYTLIIWPSISRESDAELTDKTVIIAFIGPLCLAGARRNNKQSLEELRDTDGDGTEKFA